MARQAVDGCYRLPPSDSEIAFLPLAVKFEPECTTDSLVEPERPAAWVAYMALGAQCPPGRITGRYGRCGWNPRFAPRRRTTQGRGWCAIEPVWCPG